MFNAIVSRWTLLCELWGINLPVVSNGRALAARGEHNYPPWNTAYISLRKFIQNFIYENKYDDGWRYVFISFNWTEKFQKKRRKL